MEIEEAMKEFIEKYGGASLEVSQSTYATDWSWNEGHVPVSSWYLPLLKEAEDLVSEAAKRAYQMVPKPLRVAWEKELRKQQDITPPWSDPENPAVKRWQEVASLLVSLQRLINDLRFEGKPLDPKLKKMRETHDEWYWGGGSDKAVYQGKTLDQKKDKGR